jgi:hypothetical protein
MIINELPIDVKKYKLIKKIKRGYTMNGYEYREKFVGFLWAIAVYLGVYVDPFKSIVCDVKQSEIDRVKDEVVEKIRGESDATTIWDAVSAYNEFALQVV